MDRAPASHVTKWHAFRQIGNSLPPLLGRAIGAELANALDVTPAKPETRVKLGDKALLAFATLDATKHFGAKIDEVPSHKRRIRKRRERDAAPSRAA